MLFYALVKCPWAFNTWLTFTFTFTWKRSKWSAPLNLPRLSFVPCPLMVYTWVYFDYSCYALIFQCFSPDQWDIVSFNYLISQLFARCLPFNWCSTNTELHTYICIYSWLLWTNLCYLNGLEMRFLAPHLYGGGTDWPQGVGELTV